MGGKKRLIKKGYKDTLKNHQQFGGGFFFPQRKPDFILYTLIWNASSLKVAILWSKARMGRNVVEQTDEKKKKEILKHKQLYRALDSLCLKEGGERRAWQGLIRSCNNYNNIFIKLINWESRGNCYVCCRLTMLLMLTTVKMTNNKL